LQALTSLRVTQSERSSLYLIIKVYVVYHFSYMNVLLTGGPGTIDTLHPLRKIDTIFKQNCE